MQPKVRNWVIRPIHFTFQFLFNLNERCIIFFSTLVMPVEQWIIYTFMDRFRLFTFGWLRDILDMMILLFSLLLRWVMIIIIIIIPLRC